MADDAPGLQRWRRARELEVLGELTKNEAMDLALVMAALLLPIVMGLLAKPIDVAKARLCLNLYLPFGSMVLPILLVCGILRDAPCSSWPVAMALFSVGMTAGLSLWVGRCFFRSTTARR